MRVFNENILKTHFLILRVGKNECSFFAFGNSTKKRPDNLILGRLYDGHILDMIELGVEQFRTMHDISLGGMTKKVGSKPGLLFIGDHWDRDSSFKRIQNLFTGIF